MARFRYAFLQYDIDSNSGIANPSWLLRRFAVRTSYSVWMLPADREPLNLLQAWNESGRVRWHLVPYEVDEEGQAALLAMCREALRREIREVREAVDKGLAKAADKANEAIAAAHGPKSQESAEANYAVAVRNITKRNQKILKALEEAAELFGIEGLKFASARDAVATMRANANARVALYAGMTDAVKGTKMEKAAQSSEVPGAVLADYVEEVVGQDAGAARQVFTAPGSANKVEGAKVRGTVGAEVAHAAPKTAAVNGHAANYTTSQFSWDGKAKRLTAVASALGFPAGSWPRLIRVTGDKTNSVREFTHSYTQKEGKSGITYAHYKGEEGLTLRVYSE